LKDTNKGGELGTEGARLTARGGGALIAADAMAPGNSRYGSFTPSQVEELYALLKERESQERLSGKAFSDKLRWILDSGASHHMTSDLHIIQNLYSLSDQIHLNTASGKIVCVEKAGTVIVSPNLTFKNVLFSPELQCNLISVNQLAKDTQCFDYLRA